MARKRRRKPSGQGCVYQRGAGNWWIKWRAARRIHYKGGFATRELASEVLATITANVALGAVGVGQKPAEVDPLSKLAEDWHKRRAETHRSVKDDLGRWNRHLLPTLGKLRPDEVDTAMLRRLIEAKLSEKLSSSTARLLIRLVSTFYSDLVERGLASRNPAKMLPRATRRLIRPAHDPRKTPFVERLEDVRRLYLALPDPINLAYAIGALAGLRTGEILALRWEHVDLAGRRIHVRESTGGPLKDDDSRIVPIQAALLPLLTEWHVRRGGTGQVVPPMRGGSRLRCDEHTLGKKLREALKATALARPGLRWYECTRHTFASQWVLAGGSIEKLREVLGHSTVMVTERYAHLRPDLFTASDLSRVSVDLSAPTGKVIQLPTGDRAESGAAGYAVVTASTREEARKAANTYDSSTSRGGETVNAADLKSAAAQAAYGFKPRPRHGPFVLGNLMKT